MGLVLLEYFAVGAVVVLAVFFVVGVYLAFVKSGEPEEVIWNG